MASIISVFAICIYCALILITLMFLRDMGILMGLITQNQNKKSINYKEVWTLELKDTILLMNSADYNDRFVAEYFQVKVRAEKLRTLLKKYKDGTLDFKPKCTYEMLHEQLIYMENYQKVLEARAEIEGIDISEK